MNKAELKERLQRHQIWLDGKGGGMIYIFDDDLAGADLRGANLKSGVFRNTDFHRADLRGANLAKADMRNCDLRWTNLEGTNLQGANLGAANLREANLTGANLQKANLIAADLYGADLTGADLTGANIDSASFPLWIGVKDIRVDSRIASQLAAYFCSLDCDDEDYLTARNLLMEFAKTSHKAVEMGLKEPDLKFRKLLE